MLLNSTRAALRSRPGNPKGGEDVIVERVEDLDPYAFFAPLGKRVVAPPMKPVDAEA